MTSTIAVPRSLRSEPSTSSVACSATTSIAAVGSSRIITSGFETIACASMIFCCCPPDIASKRFIAKESAPTRRIASITSSWLSGVLKGLRKDQSWSRPIATRSTPRIGTVGSTWWRCAT